MLCTIGLRRLRLKMWGNGGTRMLAEVWQNPEATHNGTPQQGNTHALCKCKEMRINCGEGVQGFMRLSSSTTLLTTLLIPTAAVLAGASSSHSVIHEASAEDG